MEFVSTERLFMSVTDILFKRILLTTYVHMNVNYGEEARL